MEALYISLALDTSSRMFATETPPFLISPVAPRISCRAKVRALISAFDRTSLSSIDSKSAAEIREYFCSQNSLDEYVLNVT